MTDLTSSTVEAERTRLEGILAESTRCEEYAHRFGLVTRQHWIECIQSATEKLAALS